MLHCRADCPSVLLNRPGSDPPSLIGCLRLDTHLRRGLSTAGYMDGRIVACYPKLPPMVGYASTATFRSASPPRAGNVYAGLDQQVASFADLPGPPVVV